MVDTRAASRAIDIALEMVLEARQEERERCAKLCETHAVYYRGTEPIKLVPSKTGEPIGKVFAAAIRADADSSRSSEEKP